METNFNILKLFKNILLLLLLTSSIGFSQNNLLKSGNNLIKVGNNLIAITPFNQFSMLFDGVDECVNIDNVRTALASTTEGAWSIWYKPGTLTNANIIGFGDANANTLIVINPFTDSKVYITCVSSGTTQWQVETDNAVISTGTWIHIVLVQDGTAAAPEIYINKIKVAQTNNVSVDNSFWFNDLSGLDRGRIGCRNSNSAGNSNFTDGNIDEVLFFNKALTQSEISDIYNNGKPRQEANIANGVSFFRMGDKSTFSGGNFTFVDQIGTNNGTSINMELNDKKLDTP